MKHLTKYKIFESRLEWKDTDLYKAILDIVSDVEDDGFIIEGLKKMANYRYDPTHPMGKDFTIGFYKNRDNGVKGTFGRYRPNCELFKISEIRNCINHLMEHGKDNDYVCKVKGELENGNEHNITNRLDFDKREFEHISISFEKVKWSIKESSTVHWDTGIDISLLCDIFADIMDQSMKIWVLQFPMQKKRKWGPVEINDRLTYTNCGRIEKLIYNREYWFDIDTEMSKNDDISDESTRKKLINIGNKILNYDWESISGRLTDIGLTVDKIEKDETTRVSFSGGPTQKEIKTGKIRIICRTI